jgi:hypothetical protein
MSGLCFGVVDSAVGVAFSEPHPDVKVLANVGDRSEGVLAPSSELDSETR